MSWIMLGTAAITAGGAVAGGMMSDGESNEPQFKMAPEYPEATDARKKLWEILQGYNADNSYGAITPAWNDIFEQAQNRVKAYYYGTAANPTGEYKRLASTAARQGSLDSPAYLRNMAKTQTEEAGMYKDLSGAEAINKATFGENARQDYLNRIAGLSTQKPNSVSYTPTPEYGTGDMIADVTGALGGVLTQQASQKQQDKLWNAYLTKLMTKNNSVTPYTGSLFGGIPYKNEDYWGI